MIEKAQKYLSLKDLGALISFFILIILAAGFFSDRYKDLSDKIDNLSEKINEETRAIDDKMGKISERLARVETDLKHLEQRLEKEQGKAQEDILPTLASELANEHQQFTH